MNLLKATMLGLIQGVTEFLPVSSSGHLVIFQKLFGIDKPPISFDIFLHLATLFAIIIVLRYEIKKINITLLTKIFITLIPTGIIGFIFSGLDEYLFNSLTLVGYALLATSTLLISTKFSAKNKMTASITNIQAFLIGIAQGIAVIPGISRSGATIVTSLWLGIGISQAFSYSFLASIPAIIGAQILEMRAPLFENGISLVQYSAGFSAALLSGWLSLKLLKQLMLKSKLHLFAIYTLLLSMIILLS